MATANINDRASVEALYPRAVFEADAAHNAVGNTQVLQGIHIESPPDENGAFALSRARRHVGEVGRNGGAVFLAPDSQHRYAALMKSDAEYGGPVEKGDALAEARDADDGYAAFIEDILETARSAEFQPPIGRGEERLRGFHGG
jgi:hypothetical protein